MRGMAMLLWSAPLLTIAACAARTGVEPEARRCRDAVERFVAAEPPAAPDVAALRAALERKLHAAAAGDEIATSRATCSAAERFHYFCAASRDGAIWAGSNLGCAGDLLDFELITQRGTVALCRATHRCWRHRAPTTITRSDFYVLHRHDSDGSGWRVAQEIRDGAPPLE